LIASPGVSNGTVRRQAIGSAAPLHPASTTSWSKYIWLAVMSLRKRGEPDSCGPIKTRLVPCEIESHTINEPRKRPCAFPSLAREWKLADIAPALSPQLLEVDQHLKIHGNFATYVITFSGSPPNAPIYF